MNPRGKAQCVQCYIETKSPIIAVLEASISVDLEQDVTWILSGYGDLKIFIFIGSIKRNIIEGNVWCNELCTKLFNPLFFAKKRTTK